MIVALYFLVGALIVTGLATERRKVAEIVAAIAFWPVAPIMLAFEIFHRMFEERRRPAPAVVEDVPGAKVKAA